ncbi:MAG: hypothetical protein CMI90_01750 [Pelagibacteraceae bacterium]|nr:hypothetical protein [Pelagibacteraceae bacterium]
MFTKIFMPSLSPTMEEGKVVSWLKKKGDEVLSGEVLFEVETDKATMEYEAPEDGFLAEIVCNLNQSLKVNSLVAVISESKNFDKDDLNNFIKDNKDLNEVAATEKPQIPILKIVKPIEVSSKFKITSLAKRVASINNIDISKIVPKGRKIKVNDLFQTNILIENFSERLFISPLAKKEALNKNLNIQKITGSGPNNRIIIRDLGENKSLDDDKLRKAIAKATVYSKQNIPHFYLNAIVSVNGLLDFRKSQKLKGNKYSLNGILMFAILESFKAFPESNCSYTKNEEFIVNKNIDIGLAVDTVTGLKMPVLKNLEALNLSELTNSLNSLIDKARSNKLIPQDLSGGVISISNLGSYNIRSFDAIIFPGQTYILSVGQIYEDVIINKGEISTGNFINLTLACDHRAVDGVLASKFFSNISSVLEKLNNEKI